MLGGRLINKNADGSIRVNIDSVNGFDAQYDGHINRNIRSILALIDMSKPYIEVSEFKEIGNDKV